MASNLGELQHSIGAGHPTIIGNTSRHQAHMRVVWIVPYLHPLEKSFKNVGVAKVRT